LDAIGFDWESANKRSFKKSCQRLKGIYKARHGLFVGTLIRAFLNGVQTIEELERVNLGLTLTADRIEALDAIGFDWRSEGISRTQER
jgi:hypothetical protein